MSWFRRRPRLRHYGDCPACGHDWREHPGTPGIDGPCSECTYEFEHRTPDAPEVLCLEVAPPPPADAWR